MHTDMYTSIYLYLHSHIQTHTCWSHVCKQTFPDKSACGNGSQGIDIYIYTSVFNLMYTRGYTKGISPHVYIFWCTWKKICWYTYMPHWLSRYIHVYKHISVLEITCTNKHLLTNTNESIALEVYAHVYMYTSLLDLHLYLIYYMWTNACSRIHMYTQIYICMRR